MVGVSGVSGAVRETTRLLLVWATDSSTSIRRLKNQAFRVACSEQVFHANALRNGSSTSHSAFKSYACACLTSSSDCLLVCGQQLHMRGEVHDPASLLHPDKQGPTLTGKKIDHTEGDNVWIHQNSVTACIICKINMDDVSNNDALGSPRYVASTEGKVVKNELKKCARTWTWPRLMQWAGFFFFWKK